MSKLAPTWLFDGSDIPDPLGYGAKALRFLSLLKHPKSARPDKALTFDPWQQRIIQKIYGPRREDGQRICKTVYLQVGRGNQNVDRCSAGAQPHIRLRADSGGQVLSAAADRKQARSRTTKPPASFMLRRNSPTRRASRTSRTASSIRRAARPMRRSRRTLRLSMAARPRSPWSTSLGSQED